jgi:ligand-binding sensor domain-containing protein
MRKGLLCIFMLLELNLCISQITKYNIRYFDHASGLTSINIRMIAQDPYGFMWIATQDGLFRHDSKGFEQYNKNYRGKRNIGGG